MNKDHLVSAIAKRLVIDSAGFEIEQSVDATLEKSFKILNYRSTKALEEEWHEVALACRSTDRCAVRALEYRAAKGQVGFNDVARPLVARFLDAFLVDAWTWSHKEQRYVCYADVKSRLERPSQFLWLSWSPTNPPQPHTMLCYHGLTVELRNMMKNVALPDDSADDLHKHQPAAIVLANDVHGMQKLQVLLQLSESCAFVSAWASDLRRPRTISVNDVAVVDLLKRICQHEQLTLDLVESEDLLPIA